MSIFQKAIQPKKAIQLLLVDDTQDEAERIAKLFRESGRAVRIQPVKHTDELEQALKQSWDLLICTPNCTRLPAKEVAQYLSKCPSDIPLIQLLEEASSEAVIEALEQGARAVLPQGEDHRLLLLVGRELASLEDRRALQAALAAQREAEKRCQLLLESSVDAIAYVHEGMHIYTNRMWQRRFGYENGEELEGISIIDLIAADDQNKLKTFFTEGLAEQADASLELSALTRDGQTFAVKLEFSPASYQGEDCIQVIIRSEVGNAELEEKLREISRRDSITGLYNYNYFLKRLDKAAAATQEQGSPAAVAYLSIDHYSELLTDIGLSGVEQLVISLAGLLREHFGQDVQLARFSDDAFSLLQTGVSAVQIEESLRGLLKKVTSRLFDIGGRTIQASLSIGLVGLEKDSCQALQAIERAHQCAASLRQGNGLKRFDPVEELAAQADSGDTIALLKQALSTDGFRLLFQPVVRLRGEPEEHYEVLLRLKTPQGEEISPREFLQIAGRAGLLAKVDRWVIVNAIKCQRSKEHLPRLFIHLSSASLKDESFVPWLANILKAAKLPEGRLIFQFSTADTEQWVAQTQTLIKGLRALRCPTVLSQFDGSARQFELLKHLPIDFIKLDGSQTQDLNEQENRDKLKELLDKIAAQNKQSIVPFVETVGALSMLWQAGAHYIQGYYLQGPADAMDYDFEA